MKLFGKAFRVNCFIFCIILILKGKAKKLIIRRAFKKNAKPAPYFHFMIQTYKGNFVHVVKRGADCSPLYIMGKIQVLKPSKLRNQKTFEIGLR